MTESDVSIQQIEDKYNGFFSRQPQDSNFDETSTAEIVRAIFSKHKSFRYKTNIPTEIVAQKVEKIRAEKKPLKVRIAWGYGKDPKFKEFDPENWYKPDMADIYSLALIRHIELSMNYPLDVTITSSWDRYLNINYYAVGKEPEPWFAKGLSDYNKIFRDMIAELMPEAKAHDSYDLARNRGIDLDKEVASEKTRAEFEKLKNKRSEMIEALTDSVIKHSATPRASLERYLKERIVESPYEDYCLTIHFGRAVQEDKIQYRTVPNRNVFEIVPPWEAEGSVIIGEHSCEEAMMSISKIEKAGMPQRVQKFKIKSHDVDCWVYSKDQTKEFKN